jgi:hypothetical protein
MFVCAEPRLETWSPDFSSSGQADPIWARLRCGGVELCNSLGWVDWLENPVQVQLCESCGTPFCADGGFVHISRLGDLILWTAPQDSPDPAAPHEALKTLGAIAFPAAVWQTLGALPADRYPPANHRAVAEAWTLGAKVDRELLAPLLAPLLANPQAIGTWQVRSVSETGARVEFIHGWPAFAFIGETAHIALNADLVLVPV